MRVKHARKTAQAAMEYLMTYGWAILIIGVVLAALFELGVFNQYTFVPRQQAGACYVYRPYGPGSVNLIALTGECTNSLPKYVAYFEGSPTNYNYYITTPSLPAYSKATIVGWVYVSSIRGGSYGSVASSHNCGPIWGESWSGSASTFGVDAWDTCSCPPINTCSGHGTINPPTNQWVMMAFTIDGTGNVLGYGFTPTKTYTSSYSGNVFTTNAGAWYLGAYDAGGDAGLNGSLANVQLYNTSLSANELQTLYTEGIGGAPTVLQHLVGWWPLNGDSNDYSGNNHNGTDTNVFYTSRWTSDYSVP